jgi:hypothetical protein
MALYFGWIKLQEAGSDSANNARNSVPLPPQPTYGRKKPANSRAKRPAADIALQNQSVTSEEQKKRSSDKVDGNQNVAKQSTHLAQASKPSGIEAAITRGNPATWRGLRDFVWVSIGCEWALCSRRKGRDIIQREDCVIISTPEQWIASWGIWSKSLPVCVLGWQHWKMLVWGRCLV